MGTATDADVEGTLPEGPEEAGEEEELTEAQKAQREAVLKTKKGILDNLYRELLLPGRKKARLKVHKVLACFTEVLLGGLIRDSQIHDLQQRVDLLEQDIEGLLSKEIRKQDNVGVKG
jgi:hypothetical protein